MDGIVFCESRMKMAAVETEIIAEINANGACFGGELFTSSSVFIDNVSLAIYNHNMIIRIGVYNVI